MKDSTSRIEIYMSRSCVRTIYSGGGMFAEAPSTDPLSAVEGKTDEQGQEILVCRVADKAGSPPLSASYTPVSATPHWTGRPPRDPRATHDSLIAPPLNPSKQQENREMVKG